MTNEKVLDVFKDYIAADAFCEVLQSSMGYLVVDWDTAYDRWITSRLCRTPEQLRDALLELYEVYQGYKRTGGFRRELLLSEEVEIRLLSEAMAKLCDEDRT